MVIANPNLALKHLHKRRSDTVGEEKLAGRVTKIYLQEFAPKTFAAFNSWEKKSRAIVPLYVGDIKSFEDEGEVVEKIVRFDKKNSAQLFSWIYQQFTGKKLGATLIQRFFQKMNG